MSSVEIEILKVKTNKIYPIRKLLIKAKILLD